MRAPAHVARVWKLRARHAWSFSAGIEARAVATVGAPSEPAHVQRLMMSSAAEIEAEGSAEVRIAGRPFRIYVESLSDARERRVLDALADGHGALRDGPSLPHSLYAALRGHRPHDASPMMLQLFPSE